MPQGSIQTIKTLLNLGAKVDVLSIHSAIVRGEPTVFQLLVDSGWDINSTEFESATVQ
jgi:hypothetical protein